MSTLRLISRIDEIVLKTGYQRSTVCQLAFKNPLAYARLQKRVEYEGKLSDQLDEFEREVTSKLQATPDPHEAAQ